MTRALGDIDLEDQATVNRAFFHALDRAGDPSTVYDRFLTGCADLVPPSTWRFDPSRVPPRSDADRHAIGVAIRTVIYDP